MAFDFHGLLYSLYFPCLLRVYKNNCSLNTYKFHLESVDLAQDVDKWKYLQTHQILLLCPSTTESPVMRTLHQASQFWKTRANNNNLPTRGQTFRLELFSPARRCTAVPCLVLASPGRLLRAHLCRGLDLGEGEQLPFVIHSIKSEECTVNVPWLVFDPLLTVVSLNTDTNLHTEREV